MPYSDHFKLADDYIVHLDAVMATIHDPFIKSRYTGFLSVSAVTVYELAIKDIFKEFANKKHKVLGNFTSAYFYRINGRIKIDDLKRDYLPKFGDKYLQKFLKKLEEKEKEILRSAGVSVKSSYGNIVTWRHHFAHEGKIPTTPTYDEVKRSYSTGKELIHCLSNSMKY